MAFNFIKTSIDGLTVIEPHFHIDDRGYFIKEYEEGEFLKHDLPTKFYEMNESMSKKGTLRGIHFQNKFPQGKLIRVIQGSVYDVAVDLREGSKTFGEWIGFYITAKKHNMLYIPEGFGHGFLALEDNTVFSYKCTNKYSPDHDSGIIWNDPILNIKWPIQDVEEILTISIKDQSLQTFKDFVERRKSNENQLYSK